MRRLACVALLLTLTLGVAPSVLADAMPTNADPSFTLRDGWSGLYIGAGGGIARVNNTSTTNSSGNATVTSCSNYDPQTKTCKTAWQPNDYRDFDFASIFGSKDWNGFGTVQIGYDRLVGNRVLVGAFADVDIYFGDQSGGFDLASTWNLGARLGALITPRFLLYGVGGYTQASASNSIVIPYSGPTLSNFGSPKGWFVGGGGEVKLRPGVSLKVEYRYADYGNSSAKGSSTNVFDYYLCACGALRDTETIYSVAHDDLDIQSVRALMVFRLDEPEPAPLK